ncbi:TonB-dependent receptor family protein [Chondromyces apiculatus]|uniref:TonB-dependent receptor n=1 Tax=Chondromyces apiculatus DSM 436 TaxID=1192034 RepID=A0A017SZF6_9BACT|nr:TonB-dependent receptor [Chondromyces apiculatus]EYF01681.1 TonB-dependent receptor [Chondromyces apiculatus DSM 436]
MEICKLRRLPLIAPLFAVLLAAPDAGAQGSPDVPQDAGQVPPTDASPPAAPEAAAPVDPSGDAAVEVAAGGTPAADAEPELQDPTEVTVVGTRARETSGSAHVIRSKQLERFEYDDPHQVLTSVPGIYVRGEDGFGLRPNIGMRGAISDRSKKLTLMEDGVLFGPAPYSAPAAYYFPLITRMSSVRVVKGPSAIVYGPHTVAGAIDLVTASIPEGPKVMLDLAAGQYFSRKIHLRASTSDESGRFGVLVEGVHLGNTGFKDLDGGGDTGFTRNEWMAKGRYDLGTDHGIHQELELKVGYSNEVSNETYLGLSDADFEATPYRRYAASRLDRMEWNRTQIALTHRLQFGPAVDLTTTAYRNDLHRIWNRVHSFRGAAFSTVLGNPADPRNALFYNVLTGSIPATTSEESLLIGPNDRTFVSQGVQTTLQWRPRTGPITHRVEVGTRAHYDSIERLHERDGYILEGDALVGDGTPTVVEARNLASTLALSMYAVDAATWGPVTLTAGARLESIHGRFEDYLTDVRSGGIQQVVLPGAGLFVALPHELGAFVGVHQGFSPIPPGQSDLVKPEKSVNYEAGVRWSPRRFRAELIGFFNDYSNLANVCTYSTGCINDGIDQQFDGGQADVYGLEAYVESEQEVAEGITIPGRLAYTFTRAIFTNDFSSADPIFGTVFEGDTVPYVPTHQLSASVGVEVGRIGVNVAGTYVSEMREIAGAGDPGPGEATDAYFLLDASANVKVFEGLTLYTTGKNLLNSTYIASRRPFGARPGAPIWIQVGAKIEL